MSRAISDPHASSRDSCRHIESWTLCNCIMTQSAAAQACNLHALRSQMPLHLLMLPFIDSRVSGSSAHNTFYPDIIITSNSHLIYENPHSVGGLAKELVVELANGQRAVVLDLSEDTVKLDANSMLAGKSVAFELELLKIEAGQ